MPMIHTSWKITARDIPIGELSPEWMSFGQYIGSGPYEYARTGFSLPGAPYGNQVWSFQTIPLPTALRIVWVTFKAEMWRTGNDPSTDIKRWRRVS